MKAEDDPFDLEKFRLRPEDVKAYADAAPPRARQARAARQFTIVPHSWSNRLKTTYHASAYKLALHLLYQHWKGGGRPIALTNVALTSAGVPRRSKWRALNELKQLGLVEVERRPAKSPLIILLKLG